MASDLLERTGPTLRALSGIDDSTSEIEARRRLLMYLSDLADELPGDLRIALRVGLALDEDAQYRFLEQRMQWLATKLDRDVRTARRRVDEAIRAAETMRAISVPSGDNYAHDGWYLERFRTLLHLDGAQPTAIEERKVVARHDFLSEIIISTSIPCPAGADRERHHAELTILYGGSIDRIERPSKTYFRYFVRLPQPLRRGQSHEIGVSVTIPADQPINPRYAFQPLRRCDEFDLRIRFGSGNRLSGVWNMAGIPRGMADDFIAASARVDTDDVGEIHLNYQRLLVGLVYGARWEMAS
ncbi:MAG: hypothetical protein ACRDOU_13420 [Streptosporangiaceae bacterium]